MITLTAEVLCDSCGKVCGVGEPCHHLLNGVADSAIELALQKARSHGAQINVVSVTCAECLAKEAPLGYDINSKGELVPWKNCE